MDTIQVRVVELKPMICASFYGYGESPEGIAHKKADAWAGPKGLLKDEKMHRIFGFDNPIPAQWDVDNTSQSKKYGYEILISLDERIDTEGEVRIVDLHGGKYAVAHMPDFSKMGEVWTYLWQWAPKNGYRILNMPKLEENLSWNDPSGKLVMDLYLPIAKEE